MFIDHVIGLYLLVRLASFSAAALFHRFLLQNTHKEKSKASDSRRWGNEREAARRDARNPSCSLSRRSDSVGVVVKSSDRLAGRLEKWGRDGGEMQGGEESLPSTALIGLMRSRVNRRTNERMPLCSGTDAQRLSSHIVACSCRYYIGARR